MLSSLVTLVDAVLSSPSSFPGISSSSHLPRGCDLLPLFDCKLLRSVVWVGSQAASWTRSGLSPPSREAQAWPDAGAEPRPFLWRKRGVGFGVCDVLPSLVFLPFPEGSPRGHQNPASGLPTSSQVLVRVTWESHCRSQGEAWGPQEPLAHS